MTQLDYYGIKYDLARCRAEGVKKQPFPHQTEALSALYKWYKAHEKPCGCILVLPTGGGKTFTAIRALCSTALSEGYKVLWLAHTHHLLAQAFDEFKHHAASVSEPKDELTVRVVSGAPGHYPIKSIERTDDVVIATLQAMTLAYKKNHPSLEKFIDASDGKLFVVFDEAHHGPAPTYRKLILSLRERCEEMRLLGLTATPVYSDEKKQGWLKEMFPNGICHQVKPNDLMAARVLAQPIVEQQKTAFSPHFEANEYQKWLGTHRDLPEKLITLLAQNNQRNMTIAAHYAANKEKYGPTIIFADRWFQCEAISKFLENKGIKAGAVYSHIGGEPSDPEAWNKASADRNANIINAFRGGELDVIINVRMLTEGTDFPNAQTAFMTRQTTSPTLLTQMVGRALRGPACGGTEKAYIVFFIDEWEHLINWAEYDQIEAAAVTPDETPMGTRPPLQWISIELVRRLAAQMDQGVSVNPLPYLTMLPIGWYSTEYRALDNSAGDMEIVRKLVMIFEHEKEDYEIFIKEMLDEDLDDYADETLELKAVADKIDRLIGIYFNENMMHFGTNLQDDIFTITQHIAQNGSAPEFFVFQERNRHDLDAIARSLYESEARLPDVFKALRLEYERTDRFWRVLYHNYQLFSSHFHGCLGRIDNELDAADDAHYDNLGEALASPETLSLELRAQVIERDGSCLCCGATNRGQLEADHIVPAYINGSNILGNLQTLCKTCNGAKGITTMNFLDPQTDLMAAPKELRRFKTPPAAQAANLKAWEQFLKRSINFFYKCGAVHKVDIARGEGLSDKWAIELLAGNDPEWLWPHLAELAESIRTTLEEAGQSPPALISVSCPDKTTLRYNLVIRRYL